MTYGPEDFAREYDVSRETLRRLTAFDRTLLDWSARINLVARSTIADRWERHYRDSAQLFALIPRGARTLVDLGSGAGFPGLVLAALSFETPPASFETPPAAAPQDEERGAFLPRSAGEMSPEAIEGGRRQSLEVTLVESVGKKAAFLGAAVAAAGLANVRVINGRIEDLRLPPADVITARALAPLPKLLAYGHEIAHETTVLILPKGQDVEVELTEAAKSWHMEVDRRPSVTSPCSTILVIRRLKRRARRRP